MYAAKYLSEYSKPILQRMLTVLNFTKNTQLAEYLKVSPQSVANAGNIKIPEDWIIRICENTEASAIWILTGDGEMHASKKSGDNFLNENYNINNLIETIGMIMMMPKTMPSEDLRKALANQSILLKNQLALIDRSEDDFFSNFSQLPVLKWESVISWLRSSHDIEMEIQGEHLFVGGKHPDNAFAVRVDNEFMVPEFFEGEFLIIWPDTSAKTGSFVIAEINKKAALRKYIEDADQKYLITLNKDYGRITTTEKDNFQILGTVTQKIKYFPGIACDQIAFREKSTPKL